jgi:hypothetical protein
MKRSLTVRETGRRSNMVQDVELKIHGDISIDVIREAERLLPSRAFGGQLTVSPGEIETSADFFPNAEIIISTAQLLVAVLGLAVTLITLRKDKSQTRRLSDDIIKGHFDICMKSGYELQEIQKAEEFMEHVTKECVVIARDVPGNCNIEIRIKESHDIVVRRRKTVEHRQ